MFFSVLKQNELEKISLLFFIKKYFYFSESSTAPSNTKIFLEYISEQDFSVAKPKIPPWYHTSPSSGLRKSAVKRVSVNGMVSGGELYTVDTRSHTVASGEAGTHKRQQTAYCCQQLLDLWLMGSGHKVTEVTGLY